MQEFDFNKKSVLLALGGPLNKAKFLETAKILLKLNYKIFATDTTAEFLRKEKIECEVVRKAYQVSPNALDIIEGKKVSFVVNLSNTSSAALERKVDNVITDGFRIRRATIDNQIPLFTDLNLGRAFIKALEHYNLENLGIKSYKEYL